ncbi:MAG: transcription-repair coupling factor [Planctomycetota bacterium]|nr:transcription-repair coupling factor [Planctomycetota bacterium]
MPPLKKTLPKRPSHTGPVQSLADMVRLLSEAQGWSDVIAALQSRKSVTIDGAWGSAMALVVEGLSAQAPGRIFVILPHEGDLDDFATDWAGFAGNEQVGQISAWVKPPRPGETPDETTVRRLSQCRKILATAGPKRVILSIQSVLQPIVSPEWSAKSLRTIASGFAEPPEKLAKWLLEQGLERVDVVEVPGEFALRGGIMDIYPFDAPDPLRLEFFGDDLESIRTFDVASQRTSESVKSLRIGALADLGVNDHPARAHLTDMLEPNDWVVLIDSPDLHQQAEIYLSRERETGGLYGLQDSWKRLIQFPTAEVASLAADGYELACHLRVESLERFTGDLVRVKAELQSVAEGDHVLIACHNEGERERLSEIFADTRLASENRLTLSVGQLKSGFRLIDQNLIVLGDHELFHRPDTRRANVRRRYESRAIDSFLDLNPGDFIVHINHGIARYLGLQMIERSKDHAEETLVLEFAAETRMYVPVSQIELVQKYIGGGKSDPPLSKLGSSTWEKRKKKVADALIDLAGELLEIQAARAAVPGFAYPAEDSAWYRQFEAAFPYDETTDQLAAIEAIRNDLSQPKPMDRLICGDVGYGKTELAIRAAFRAVESGKQVAILVPTTVLAEQHYHSFSARMAEYPFTVEVLNRFRPKSEMREVIKRTAYGGVDVLIGTHRILQKDVQFKDLGLVVIDEEQRFGVEDKEWLKSLKTTVDVLTLSATPIPRTLHMSLLGIRDISNLETPPAGRKAIETRISRFDPDLVRRAINRELNRDGQIFFVHNRVHDIQSVADRIKHIVPEARIIIAHGQMAGEELERAMLKFVRHEADILLATTIIESGLDIPNANTIFINEADKYGLADLHQLRGRVGRFKNRAYAYLLLENEKPVTPNAVKRLKAIEEFTDLGAGFKIALRDLEIRGAGNILGSEQSGHIEAVGYELFCTLLEKAVRKKTGKKEPPPVECLVEIPWKAWLPKDYVDGHRVKVELYRRLGRLRTLDRIKDFAQELVDRFGALPPQAENLMRENELRVLAARWGVDRIHTDDGFAVLRCRSATKLARLASLRPGEVRLVDDLTGYIPLEERRPPAHVIANRVSDILKTAGG